MNDGLHTTVPFFLVRVKVAAVSVKAAVAPHHTCFGDSGDVVERQLAVCPFRVMIEEERVICLRFVASFYL
jgi:hypothetical protein